MAEIPTTPPQPVDKSVQKDIVLGTGVRLRSIRDIHSDLKDTGLSYRGLTSWIRSLNIPIIYIGNTAYVNPFFFQLAVYAITRPGSPDFLVPGCSQLSKNRKSTNPVARELSTAYFNENVHNFVSEIISARRFSFRKSHGGFTKQARNIIDRITHQYDLMRGPAAVAAFKKTAANANASHHNSSESPLQDRDPRISSLQDDTDVDPLLSPQVNAPVYSPKKELPDASDRNQ